MSDETIPFTAGGFEGNHKWTDADVPELESTGQPVVVGSIATFHGGDTAGIRMRNVRADGVEMCVEEETSGDDETWHTNEEIRFLGAPSGPITDASGNDIGEAGVVGLEQPDGDHWHTIELDDSYDDPVVLTQIMTYNGQDACHGRVRDVRSDRFEFQIEEWDVHNGPHIEETIGYVVLEEGIHTLPDENPLSEGTPVEVTTVSTDHNWSDVSFSAGLGTDPAVVSRSQTENGHHEIVTRQRNADDEGVEVRLQEEEGRGGDHVEETVGVVATPRRDVEIGFGRVPDVDHDWTEFTFETRITASSPVVLANIDTFNGEDTVAPRLRTVTATDGQVFLEEETSQNDERRHNEETVSVVSLTEGPIADANGDRIGWAGTVEFGQSDENYWHTVDFGGEEYDDPVVFATMQTYNGEHPSHVRLRNVGSGSFELQIEEWDYLNGPHVEETIGYLYLESGTHTLSDGSQLHVGTTQSTHQWFNVEFIPDFESEQPALLTQCQTYNGYNEVVTRTTNLDAHGFDVRLQEEEGSDGRHDVESVGFLGIARPGRNTPSYETERVLDTAVEGFSLDDCVFAFDNDFPAGEYTLPNPIDLGPAGSIDEIGDTTNGMCGGMVLAVRDYFEHGRSPWPDDLVERSPPNSPVDDDQPAEDTALFDFLSERLFDSFMPGNGNPLGAGIYQTLMNSPNTKKWGQVKKSRNEVMRQEWRNEIKPALDSDTLCPIGLIHVDTHGNIFKTGLNQIGDNHQVLAYGYSTYDDTVEIYVYDPNAPNDTERRIQFTDTGDLSDWFEPSYVGSSKPVYAFFAVPYSPKSPPRFD
ncbi:hypothetical protein [Halovivax limisalsi]|uniref:hypothetical protein n=1 Tax=Halovivax limisalsi TaxID=1453760 RepID=UPI001FFDE3DD|nr:hypothetical protein [Halovivax limisalsi]